jgi:hypothetical protein
MIQPELANYRQSRHHGAHNFDSAAVEKDRSSTKRYHLLAGWLTVVVLE